MGPIDARNVQAWFEQTLPAKLLDRVAGLNPVERGLALGSKLFTAVVPLSILMGGVLSSREAVADRLVEGFGLTGSGRAALEQLFRVPSGEVASSVSVIGVLVLLYSMVSFARTLQRVYEDAWGLPALRSHGIVWGMVWVVAFAVYFSLSAPLTHLLHRHGLNVTATIVSLGCGTVLWMVTPFILLGRRVAPRVLVPGGVATAVFLTAFNLGSRVYLPGNITRNVDRYGLVGVTFAILSWLFAFSLTLIVSAACGAVLAERRTDWARPQPPE
jgi:membrane protein